ncbi:MAG: PqqD family protein [Pyrinomonadaceae bacterium]
MTLQTPFEHIIFTEFDGREGVLVDLNAKRYYTLNETAMLVWSGLERGRALPDIVDDLTNAYEVTPEHASASIERLLDDLRAHKLIRQQ